MCVKHELDHSNEKKKHKLINWGNFVFSIWRMPLETRSTARTRNTFYIVLKRLNAALATRIVHPLVGYLFNSSHTDYACNLSLGSQHILAINA